MNIFFLDNDVKTCAEYHVDKHVVKMILEYAQLLSTAHRVLDGTEGISYSKTGRKQKVWTLKVDNDDRLMYKATHINHPSAVWVRQSEANYIWLSKLLRALCTEYTYRYNKVHKVQRDGLMDKLIKKIPKNISYDDFTEPTPAMPDKYIVAGDSVQSYKNYYLGDKQRMFSWKMRNQPSWVTSGLANMNKEYYADV